MKAKKSLHLIHSPEHAGWIFDAAHPTQGRRYINAFEKLLSLAKTCDVEIVEVAPRIATESELERVHSATMWILFLTKHYPRSGKVFAPTWHALHPSLRVGLLWRWSYY